MKDLLYLLTIIFFSSTVYPSSSAHLTGRILQADTKEPVTGASVFLLSDKNVATVSDLQGNYLMELPAGPQMIICSFIGMENDTAHLVLMEGQSYIHDFFLRSKSHSLKMVVVSSGKFEQRIEDLTVSMEVIKPSLIENRNSTNISDALEQVPGVTILDGEPQVRSGSGYSFGVGSRVAVLVDGLPVLIGDQGRPEWSFIPTENIEQVEIIKGASSVLYGSSALSGVINIRTTYPKEKPFTHVKGYYGQYDKPGIPGSKWWTGSAPLYGYSFLHSARLLEKKQLDFTVGALSVFDHNYIGPPMPVPNIPIPVDTTLRDEDVATLLTRLNFSLRYRPLRISNLSFGLNGNFMQSRDNFSLIWLNDSSGLYRAFPGTMTISDNRIFYFDPFINYYSESGLRHSFSFRLLYNDASNTNQQSNQSTIYYSEYQLHKEFKSLGGFNFTGGIVSNAVQAHAELYAGSGSPDNTLNNYATYTQFDKKLAGVLNVSAGFRGEYFEINRKENVLKPIFRSGFSLQLSKATYLRSSFGMGYRYPTITEKYIYTSAGGLYVFPNPDLQPETSRNLEAGLKQGFKAGGFMGYIDVAVFWQDYFNTIEYNYAIWEPEQPGFKFINTGDSRIRGIECTLNGTGNIFDEVELTVLSGYTYALPQAVQPGFVYATDKFGGLKPNELSYNSTSTDTTDYILKYRFEHTAKSDIELKYRLISIGFSWKYYSFMRNIDNTFYKVEQLNLLPSGLKKFREENNSGTSIIDFRIRTKLNKNFELAFIVNNVQNKVYSLRPLKMESPRTLTVQCSARF